jgi:hypothetical protein
MRKQNFRVPGTVPRVRVPFTRVPGYRTHSTCTPPKVTF